MQALANAIVRADKWIQAAGPSEIIATVPESFLLGDRAVYIDAFLAANRRVRGFAFVASAKKEITRCVFPFRLCTNSWEPGRSCAEFPSPWPLMRWS